MIQLAPQQSRFSTVAQTFGALRRTNLRASAPLSDGGSESLTPAALPADGTNYFGLHVECIAAAGDTVEGWLFVQLTNASGATAQYHVPVGEARDILQIDPADCTSIDIQGSFQGGLAAAQVAVSQFDARLDSY